MLISGQAPQRTTARPARTSSSRLPALIRWPPRQYYLVNYHDRGSALENDADEVSGFPGSRQPIHATALRRTNHYYPPSTFERIHPASLRLHHDLFSEARRLGQRMQQRRGNQSCPEGLHPIQQFTNLRKLQSLFLGI